MNKILLKTIEDKYKVKFKTKTKYVDEYLTEIGFKSLANIINNV